MKPDAESFTRSAPAARAFAMPPQLRRLHAWGVAAALFLLVVGAKWATVDRFGSDIPNWDQWDAEGLELLAPWFERDHFLQHLFTPHNEHRIVLTKLQNLAVTLLAGQWDSRLECGINAVLHAALAVAFWLAGRRWIDRRWHAPLFVVLAALFGLPFAWQNILGGFHSQQYWLLALSLVALVWLPFARPWSGRWWAAAAAVTLALITMGSGFFAAAIAFALLVLRLLRRDTSLREVWPTLLLTLALIAAGIATRVEVPYHEQLRAKSAHDFFLTVVRNLQWPVFHGANWLAALLLWTPWLLVTWRAIQPRPGTDPRRAQTMAALGGWVLLQILATGYARGAGGDLPASRYMDTLGFGMAVNALALGWLVSRSSGQRTLRPWVRWSMGGLGAAFAVAWLVVLGRGLHETTSFALRNGMPDAARSIRLAEAYTRAYLVTGDRADLLFDDIPYPGADSFIQRVARPSLRVLMPVSVRPPLPLQSGASPTSGFAANHARLLHLDTEPRHGLSPATAPLASLPTWGSYGATGLRTTGEWRSAPLAAPLQGWLKFETAGQPGESGVALELRDATSDALLSAVRPSKIPGATWRAAYAPAPHAPFVVVARDADPTRWLAFSAPVEMSTLSYQAWRTMKHGLLLVEIAAVAAVLLFVLAALGEGRGRRTPPMP